MKRLGPERATVRARARQGGFALIAVLVVLLALLVLCAPFLLSARNVSKASFELSDRVQAELALDAAARHARAELGRSHPSIDATPFWDDAEELAVHTDFDRAVLDPHDAQGVMWDVTSEDAAGRIDLNSASPHVIANLLGLATYLSAGVQARDESLPCAKRGAFPPSGWLWVQGEFVRYAAVSEQSFDECQRGVGSLEPTDEAPFTCGPLPPTVFALGTPVIDARALLPCVWRLLGGTGELRTFDAARRLRETAELALGEGLDEGSIALLERFTTVWADARGERRWQRPARVTDPIRGGVDCAISVDDGRWFCAGSTVRISDGRSSELGLVQRQDGPRIWFEQPLVNDYAAYEAEARALVRRPVNLNVARPEVLAALFENLKLRAVNSRITGSEARELAALVVESRPFTGHEDFLRRVVLPAAGLEELPADAPVVPAAFEEGSAGLISTYDALALYRNGLNANDAGLEFSTMPFAFTSQDVFELDLRSAVNAKSGVLRAQARRAETRVVVPQGSLLQVWARQEDFEQSLRLDREAPWWASGPRATSRYDGATVPPSRLWAHMGVLAGQAFLPGVSELPPGADPASPPSPERVFADREDADLGYAAPWPARTSTPEDDFAEHFDQETRDPEGRYLPDETLVYAADDAQFRWVDSQGLLQAFHVELWVKPLTLNDGVLFDVGGGSLDSDRATLALEQGELVLRVRDATEDHPTTALVERAEVRFDLALGDGPGFQPDTWSHVELDVSGNRPDQMGLFVDGQAFGVRTPGRTRLTAALPQGATLIQIEDGEGFPDVGAVVIGSEVIEYRKTGPNTLDGSRQESGPQAGQGGRVAREFMSVQTTGDYVPIAGLAKQLSHAAGTPVQLYGYSAPLLSNVQIAAAQLPADLGAFAVGIVDTVQGGQTSQGDPIIVQGPATGGFSPQQIGTGIDVPSKSSVTGITLAPADPTMPAEELMAAFSPNGGYAAFVQGGVTGPAGGLEVFRYGSRSGAQLTIAERGVAAITPDGTQFGAAGGPFVVDWTVNLIEGGTTFDPEMPPDQRRWEVFVVPVSVPAPGASFDPPPANESALAQITRLDQPELTEWFRYDEVRATAGGQHLVRNELGALLALREALVGIGFLADPELPPPGGGGPGGPIGPGGVTPGGVTPGGVTPGGGTPGGQPGGGQPGGGPPAGGQASALALSAPAPSARPAQGQTGGANWQPDLGQPSDLNYPVTRAAREAFQFRGVFGTYSQRHPGGARVLPCFRVLAQFEDHTARPGRLDMAHLIDVSTGLSDRGWAVQVQRAYFPYDHLFTGWQRDSDPPVSLAPVVLSEERVDLRAIYVALSEAAPIPFVGDDTLVSQNRSALDTRALSRLVLFPSGELPRLVERVTVGSSVQGADVPSATVDELAFAVEQPLTAAARILRAPLSAQGDQLELEPSGLRTALGDVAQTGSLTFLPPDAGLLRIGSEIVCYDSIDTDSGILGIAPGGRGLLGTDAEPHQQGEAVTFLWRRTVSVLDRDVSGGDATLPLADLTDFAPSGTVRMGDELAHYTHTFGGALAMPAASSVPGEQDGEGIGLFRGRYGTLPSAQVTGTPVIAHPFRYWDRGAERADAPELAYFGLSLQQPSAFWRGVFWEEQKTPSGAARLEVLVRTDPSVPWDADPLAVEGLALLRDGFVEGQPNPIGAQADRIEARVFVRFEERAYDAIGGLSHGWKEAPRLGLFGFEYLAPSVLLGRVAQ